MSENKIYETNTLLYSKALDKNRMNFFSNEFFIPSTSTSSTRETMPNLTTTTTLTVDYDDETILSTPILIG